MPDQHSRCHRHYRIHRFLNRLFDVSKAKVRDWIRRVVLVVDTLLVAFLGIVQFCNPLEQEIWLPFAGLIKWLYENRFSVAVVIVLVQLGCRIIGWVISRRERFSDEGLHSILDYVVRRHFKKQDTENHVYRATVFSVRSCWPFGSWLGIAGRSGNRYPKRTTVFSIDPNSKEHNTGIAGECCWRNGQTIIRQLPDASETNCPPEVIDDYLTLGFSDRQEFKTMNVRSRVFLATGIRVKGKVWGILILDTTDPSKYPKQVGKHGQDLDFAAVAIGSLVARQWG